MHAKTIASFFATTIFVALQAFLGRAALAADPSPTLGTSWTLRQSPAGLHSVAFGAGKFVAVGQGKLATSPDGVVWTEHPAPPGIQWTSLVYAQGKFVAVSSEDSASIAENVMTSTDGLTWTQASDGLALGNRWRSLVHGNDRFVAGGAGVVSNHQLMTSPNGTTWTAGTVTSGTSGVYAVGYGNGTFVAVAFSNGYQEVTRIHSSTDGVTWVARQIPREASEVELSSVTYGGGQFVAVGDNQVIFTSPDGVTWTDRSPQGAFSLSSVVYGDGVFVALGYRSSTLESVILRSIDGISWSEQTAPSPVSRNSAFYAHGVIVAVATYRGTTSDTIMTSGAFGVSETAAFAPNTARLTESSKSSLRAALNQLDPSLKIKATFVIKTTKRLSRSSLASRRSLALLKFFAKQTGFKVSTRVLVRKVTSLPSSEVNTASGVFRYK